MPVRVEIYGLAWDEACEEKINRRLATDDLDDFIVRNDFLVYPNSADHPPGRFKLIGQMPSGAIWTVILQEPEDGNPEHWKPITAYRSSDFEQRKLLSDRNRPMGRKGRN